MLNTVKTQNVHTWFWLHSSNSNVQVNKRPKSQMKTCTWGGWNGADARKRVFVSGLNSEILVQRQKRGHQPIYIPTAWPLPIFVSGLFKMSVEVL